MTKLTFDLITAIKSDSFTWNKAVAKCMSEYTGSSEDVYGETLINRILQDAVVDYISTCDNKALAVKTLLEYITDHGSHSLGYCYALYLDMVQVRRDGKYINGFEEFAKDRTEE